MPYALDSVGLNASGAGALNPGMVASPSGKLLALQTGVFSVSLGPPTIAGWTLVSPLINQNDSVVYLRIGQPGDAAPSVQWDASHPAFARIAAFSGDIYTDLSTIVLQSGDIGTNTTGSVRAGSMSVPSINTALVLRGGHCVKSSVNNFASFNDWTSNPGIFTKIGGDVNLNNNSIAATWWYWQQTTALGLSADSCALPTAESTSANAQGWTLYLRDLIAVLPVGGSSIPELPVRRQPSAAQQVWQVPITLTSLPPPVPPAPTFDYSVPRGRQMSRAILDIPTNILPLGTDRVLTPATWDYEWDKPSLPVYLRAECTGLTALEMFATQNLPPYQEFNWPVPRAPRQMNRSFEQAPNLNLRGQDVLPPGGPQKNMWDPPRAARRPVENLSSLSSGLSLFYFVPPKPVGMQLTDLPPQPARRSRPDFQLGMSASLLKFLTTLPPFLPSTDLPPRRPRRLFSLSYEYSSSLLYRDLTNLPPGRQVFDLPPRRRVRSIEALYPIYAYSQITPPTPPPGPPASSGAVAGPGGRIILMPKKVGETVIRPFDFISRLGALETITSAVTTAFVYSGVDPNPALIINGAAKISGTIINQSLTGGVLGVIYELLCTVNTSLGQRLEMSAFWVVEPDLP